MRHSLHFPARPAGTLAAVLVVGALVAPTAALASPPGHSNAGGSGVGNNGVACDDPPPGGGNPGQGNAGNGNAGDVGNVCDDPGGPQDPNGPGDSDIADDDPGASQDAAGPGDSDIPDDDGDDPDGDDPDGDDPDGDDPDGDDPDGDDPDGDDPIVGGERCDDLLVTLSPTAIEGDGSAVAITAQTLEQGVPGWASATWQAAPGTTLTAVTARTVAGDITLPPTATGTVAEVESLTFCGTTAGEDPTAPDQPSGDTATDKPAKPASSEPTTPRTTTPPPATPTTLVTTSTNASTDTSAPPITDPTPGSADATPGSADATPEDVEVLGIQLAANDADDESGDDEGATAAVGSNPSRGATGAAGVRGLVVGSSVALGALMLMLIVAWRRRRDDRNGHDIQEVAA